MFLSSRSPTLLLCKVGTVQQGWRCTRTKAPSAAQEEGARTAVAACVVQIKTARCRLLQEAILALQPIRISSLGADFSPTPLSPTAQTLSREPMPTNPPLQLVRPPLAPAGPGPRPPPGGWSQTGKKGMGRRKARIREDKVGSRAGLWEAGGSGKARDPKGHLTSLSEPHPGARPQVEERMATLLLLHRG